MKLIYFLICLLVAEALNPWATAAPPSITYTTRFELVYTSNGVLRASRSDFRDFIGNSWIFPAEQDPEGNWGQAVSGLQISSRLSKPSFTLGEPVLLHLLFRNISGGPKMPPVGGRPAEVLQLMVTSDDNRPAREWWQRPIDPFGMPWPRSDTIIPVATMLDLNMQAHCMVLLDQTYDLTRPGRYFVSAGYSHAKLDGNGKWDGDSRIEARSGTAMFEIVAAPGATGGSSPPGAVHTNLTGNTGQPSPPPLASTPATATNVISQADASGGHATQGASSVVGRSPMATDVTPQEATATPARRNLVLSAWLAGLVLLGALGLWLLRRKARA